MIRQIRFEFQKNFIKPSIVLAMLIFLLMDAFLIRSLHQKKSIFSLMPEFRSAYETLYGTYRGAITDEKIEDLLAVYRPIESVTKSGMAGTECDSNSLTYNSYSDELFLRWCFVDPIEYDYKYQHHAAKIVNNALENMELYQHVGNDYAYRQSERIAKLFSGRAITEFHYTEMYQYYLQYDFSVFFVLLICIYALVNVYVMEKESEMNLLLITTVNGNRREDISKIIASSLFVIGICFFFWIADFLFFGIFFGGFEGGSSPIYAVEYFENSPLELTLFQYSILSMALKTVGVLVFGLLVLLLSFFCKSALFPFVGSILMIGESLGLYAAKLPPLFDRITLWNPACLLVNRELFHGVNFVNWFGVPVLTCAVSIGAAIILLVLLNAMIIWRSGGIYRNNRKRRNAGGCDKI